MVQRNMTGLRIIEIKLNLTHSFPETIGLHYALCALYLY